MCLDGGVPTGFSVQYIPTTTPGYLAVNAKSRKGNANWQRHKYCVQEGIYIFNATCCKDLIALCVRMYLHRFIQCQELLTEALLVAYNGIQQLLCCKELTL